MNNLMEKIRFFTYYGCRKKNCNNKLKEYSFKRSSFYLLLSGEIQLISKNQTSQIIRSMYSNYWIPYRNYWDFKYQELVQISPGGILSEIWVMNPQIFDKFNLSVKMVNGGGEKSQEKIEKNTLFYVMKSVEDPHECFTVNGIEKTSYFVEAEETLTLNISSLKPVYLLKITCD